MLWIAGESENRRATPMHALYSTVVATADGTSGRIEANAMFMHKTAACTMTEIHCWQRLQSGPLCLFSVVSREQAAGKALSANSHPLREQ
eukprot:1147827-Pelagomonas_calceolata.AAC.1